MWFKWVLIGFLALNAIGNVLKVGRDREPLTPEQAAGEVAFCLGLIAAILYCWR